MTNGLRVCAFLLADHKNNFDTEFVSVSQE